MDLDCVKAADVGRGDGWVIVNRINGGIVAHDTSSDTEFAWMAAAHKLAEALSDIQRTIHAASPQR